MSTPHRFQLKRTKGWKMPEGAVNCGRPGAWCNPFAVVQYGTGYRLELFTRRGETKCANRADLARKHCPMPVETREKAVEAATAAFRELHDNPTSRHAIRHFLAGKPLGCWCKPGQPCHADHLLTIANAPEPEKADQPPAGH